MQNFYTILALIIITTFFFARSTLVYTRHTRPLLFVKNSILYFQLQITF